MQASMVNVLPAVASSFQEKSAAVHDASSNALPLLSESVKVRLVVEIETTETGLYDLEKFLVSPKAFWLRHWIGEALSYVVRLARGRSWRYRVVSGKLRRYDSLAEFNGGS